MTLQVVPKMVLILSVTAVEFHSRCGLDVLIPSSRNNKFSVWITACFSVSQKVSTVSSQEGTSSSAQSILVRTGGNLMPSQEKV